MSCADCTHIFEAGREGENTVYGCRRFPPQTGYLLVPARVQVEGQPMRLVKDQWSSFPRVHPAWTCGEFNPVGQT